MEKPVFFAAMALIAIHLADLSGVTRSPYTLVVAGLLLAAVLGYPHMRRSGRVTLAVLTGLVALGFGVANSVLHAVSFGPNWADITATGFAIAGLLLVVLGAAVLTTQAGDQPRLSRRQLVGRGAAALIITPIVVILVALPLALGVFVTHPPRPGLGSSDLGTAYDDVSFHAADGTELKGWYVPSRNRAAVILMHGSGGDRTGTVLHARMLARNGYGVLLFDQRGHGDSGGHGNMLGWNAYPDVQGAISFLKRKPGVDHVAGLGLSMGGEVLLNATARDRRIEAVVADGAEDVKAEVPFSFQAIEAIGGVAPPTPLTDLVAKIAPRPAYLIATTQRGVEANDSGVFARRIGPSAERWVLTDAGHTGGLKVHPREYEQRVIGFLDRALGVPA